MILPVLGLILGCMVMAFVGAIILPFDPEHKTNSEIAAFVFGSMIAAHGVLLCYRVFFGPTDEENHQGNIWAFVLLFLMAVAGGKLGVAVLRLANKQR